MKNLICVVCGIFECEKDSNKCCSCNSCIRHFLKQNKDNFSYRDWVLDGVKNQNQNELINGQKIVHVKESVNENKTYGEEESN